MERSSSFTGNCIEDVIQECCNHQELKEVITEIFSRCTDKKHFVDYVNRSQNFVTQRFWALVRQHTQDVLYRHLHVHLNKLLLQNTAQHAPVQKSTFQSNDSLNSLLWEYSDQEESFEGEELDLQEAFT